MARAGQASRVRAHAADRFVDSVGVCTHLDSTPYAERFAALSPMIAALGVRHLRDEIRPTNDVSRWRRLVEAAGIKFQLLVSPTTNTPSEMVTFIKALGPTAVSAVEGQNEGDSQWFTAQESARPNWAEVVVRTQRDAFAALRGHSETQAILITSPTVLDYRPEDMRQIRAAAPFSDAVALHAYLQGQQQPETTDDYAGIEWYLRSMRDPFKPGAPAMVTETGYATGPSGVSEQAAAIYLPRLLLHLFDHGIARSFIYELMDEGVASDDPEQSYGILTVRAQAKPAYHTLRSLVQGLSDPGPRVLPALIALGIDQAPADFRMLPFRKRSGEIILAAWRTARVWDPDVKRDVAIEPVVVRLHVPGRSAVWARPLGAVSEWRPIAVSGTRVELAISAAVTLIRLS